MPRTILRATKWNALSAHSPTRFHRTASPRVQPGEIGWTLWAVLTTIPWLLPTHSAPWTTVYQELLMAAALLAAGIQGLLFRGRWQIDALAGSFCAAAALPLLQMAAGMFQLPAEAPLISLYLIGVAATLLVARRAEEVAPGRLIDSLFAGLLIAALLSTGLALYQWLGGDALGILVSPMPWRDRPVANVGQPNNLATLLVWGLIATWWGHSRRTIGAIGAVSAAFFLLFGVTLTQSRAGALQVALLGAAAILVRGKLCTRSQTSVFVALTAWWLAGLFALEPLTDLITQQVTRPMLNLDSPRERTMLLKTVAIAIGEHPWLGYGWYQNVPAHVAVSGRTAMHGLIANSHNIVLDLFVWNGVPLGLLCATGLCWWYWRTARKAVSAEEVLLLLALATFAVHANLELPHVFAYFLLPVAVLMGTLSARLPIGKPVIALGRGAVAVVLCAFAIVLCALFDEYRRIETSLTEARMRAARIEHARVPSDPHAVLLSSLQAWLTTLQVEPTHAMSDAQLVQWRRIVTRYPTALGLVRYAQASAMNGRDDDARWALDVLCNVRPISECEAAAGDWANLAAAGEPELATVLVPVPRRPAANR